MVADTIKVVSSSLLGLTVGCAQCHNHRYDPIPQADYYRVRALFEPAYDWKAWRAPGGRLVSLWTDEQIEAAKAADAELKALADERKTELDKIVEEIFASEVAKLAEDKQELARSARAAIVKDRSLEQKQILKDHPSLNVNPGSAILYNRKRIDEFNKGYADRQEVIQDRRPAEDLVPCLTEVPGQLPPTFVFFRGDITQPKQQVEPGELTVLATPTVCDSHRRPGSQNIRPAAGICQVAHQRAAPARRPRAGQPVLAAPFRPRHRRHARRFRLPRRTANASGVARLAGDPLHGRWLGAETPAPAARGFGRLSAVIPADRRDRPGRSRKSPARPDVDPPPGSRGGPRFTARRGRPAEWQAAWAARRRSRPTKSAR